MGRFPSSLTEAEQVPIVGMGRRPDLMQKRRQDRPAEPVASVPHPLDLWIRLRTADGFTFRVAPGFADRIFEGSRFLPDSRVFRRREVKSTVSRQVEAVDLAGAPPVLLLVKRYLLRPPPDDLLRGILFPTPAEIELGRGLDLASRGIAVAEPLAAGWRPAGLLACESVLVSPRLEGARELLTALRHETVDQRGRLGLIKALRDPIR